MPIVQSAISEKPNLLGKDISMLLKLYVIVIFLTYALITKVKTIISAHVFGDPDKNFTYLPALAERLDEGGHDYDFFVKAPKDVWKRLLDVVLQEKMQNLKKDEKMMVKAKKIKYIQAWESANQEMLDEVGLNKNCGVDSENGDKFVIRIFLSIAPAKNTVPLLQTVYQVDAAHMNFGKYTLYSCYGITSNCNSFPLAFGIVLSKEKLILCLISVTFCAAH